MKTLLCHVCGKPVEGTTFEDWLQSMHAHYRAEHAELMAAMAGKPSEEGEKWRREARTEFDA